MNDPAPVPTVPPAAPVTIADLEKIALFANVSQIRAALTSAGILIAFALSFVTAVARYVSARNFLGLWAYVHEAPTLTGLSAVAAGALWVWRIIANWRKQGVFQKAAVAPPLPVTPPSA